MMLAAQIKTFKWSPHHTKLVLTTLCKMLPNVLKLCANGVNVEANCLRSVYELYGRARTDLDGKGAPNFESVQNYPVLQYDGLPTYLKRDGRTTNGIAVLRSN